MSKAFNWYESGSSRFCDMPGNVTLVASPDRTHPITGKSARGTFWHAQASQWDEPTRCMSRYGRDSYGERYDSAKDAMRAAEGIWLEANCVAA